jgi:predicted amidohydrolase YtcJ
MDGRTGVLAPGALADVAVLSGDLFGTPTDGLAGLRVDLTLVEGEVAWERTGGGS